MKENFLTRLFGDNAPTDHCPQCLFREEWNVKRSETLRGLAELITSLIPEEVVKKFNEVSPMYSVKERILNSFFWLKDDARSVLAPWYKENPEPLMTRKEFLHYLCEYLIQKEKGGAL